MQQIKNAKDLLIKVCKFNNKLVESITDLNYINKDDIKEIRREWTNDKCKEVLQKLSKELKKKEDDRLGCHIHPWCVLYNFDNVINHNVCDKCEYGERNGQCSKRNSTYSKIVRELRKKKIEGIENIPGITALMKAIIDPFY